MGLRERVVARLRPPHPLGEGLWRGDFDRVDRASQRVLQVLAHQGSDDEDLVAQVARCRELVWRCCERAFARDPAAGRDVPGDDDLAAVHRGLSRAATSMAQAAQALVIARDDRSAATRAVAQAHERARAAAAALGLPG